MAIFQANARARPANPRQRGISLYTLLAAVVVLSVLTSAIVTQFSGSNTKGQALRAIASNIGEAANRFHLDTMCYPTDIRGLYDYNKAKDSNTCGATIPQSDWHGPYIKQMPQASSGKRVEVTDYGPQATLELVDASTGQQVRARKVPEDIAEAAFDACGGTGSPCKTSGSGMQSFIYVYAPD